MAKKWLYRVPPPPATLIKDASDLSTFGAVLNLAELGLAGLPKRVQNNSMRPGAMGKLRAMRGMAGTYTVQSGDTMTSIASQYGVSLASLEGMNSQISDFDVINVGDSINVPDASGNSSPPSSGSGIDLGGDTGYDWMIYLGAAVAVGAGGFMLYKKKEEVKRVLAKARSGFGV